MHGNAGTTDAPPDNYQLRGYMVERMSRSEIAAKAAFQYFDLMEIGLDIEKITDHLYISQGIVVHVEDNKIWDEKCAGLKQGESIPSLKYIALPERVFLGAANLKNEDVETFFHELGHVVLNHKPVYMKSDGYKVTELDDAEGQADLFAEMMMRLYRIYQPKQLDLFA